MEKLTASLEDYLETIWINTETSQKIRPIDVSKIMNVSRASVTEALNKLSKKGYIRNEKYQTITLTEQGEEIAKKIVSKHRTLQHFFEKILNLSTEESTENACKIEHVITDNAFKQILEFVEKNT